MTDIQRLLETQNEVNLLQTCDRNYYLFIADNIYTICITGK